MTRLSHEAMHYEMHANASEHWSSQKKCLADRLSRWRSCDQESSSDHHRRTTSHHENVMSCEKTADRVSCFGSRLDLRNGRFDLVVRVLHSHKMITLVPNGTRSKRSSTCTLIMRTQPFETDRPIEDGSVVP